MLGAALAAALFLGASIALVVDVFLRVPDFTLLRSQVKVPIRLADGRDSFKMIGPRAPGWVPLSAISKFLPRSIVSSDDSSFYSHDGIDIYEIKEAIKKDWQEKRFAHGASTLTQQVLKNVFLGRQKTIWRKVKEIIWAREIEKVLSKSEIIQFYMNMAEWGPGIYGVKEASEHYFSLPPSGLSAKQCAFLTMLLPSPRRYHAYFKRRQLTQWADRRVNRILQIMLRMGYIQELDYQQAVAEQLWGVPVLPDTSPGVPSDPGEVSENPTEEFEAPSAETGGAPIGQSEVSASPTPSVTEDSAALPVETPSVAPSETVEKSSEESQP
jgi:monofunctional biosynthetic peptidoglycan transglycosylase